MNTRKMKISLILLLAALLTGCSAETDRTEDVKTDMPEAVVQNETAASSADTEAPEIEIRTQELWKAKDLYTDYADGIAIRLDVPESGEGYTVTDSGVTVTKGGTYILTGTLADGQITVDAAKTEDVRLVLDNVSVHCSTASPIEVKKADKVIISLPDGTESTLSNGEGLVPETDEEVSAVDIAAILSAEDLTVNGTGTLRIAAASGDGIRSKDTLKITGGNLVISAADRGLVGKDAVLIQNCTADIASGGDGIKSNNAEDPALGYVYIEGGEFRIVSGKDGIQAETLLDIRGGTFDITTGTGSYETAGGESFGGNMGGGRGGFRDFGSFFGGTASETDDSTESQKGLKAGTELRLSGGTIAVDAYDDALHSDGSVTITDGVLTAASGDDGIHGEETVSLGGGTVTITRSYEGIEGKIIDITGGIITVTASDDGLNATDGTGDTMGMFMGRGGSTASESSVYVHIGGGEVYVDARGDGLDSNGTFTIEGGTVVVYGPSDGANGYVDTAGAFIVSGGTYFGMGSSQMMVTPDASSGQASVTMTMSSWPAGTDVEIRDSEGNTLYAVQSVRQFNALTFSSPDLVSDGEYTVYINGEAAGTAVPGSSSGSMGGMGNFGGSMGGGRGDKGNRNDFGMKPDASGNMTMPGMPEGGMMPEMPEGGMMPEMPEGGMMPGIPEGGMMPEMPEGGMMPGRPEGGMMPGRGGFGRT